MKTVTIRGIPISFPFEPYEIQKEYMEKVLECIQNETNGVLESPTGTGKTFSLLCSALAWLQLKKTQVQAQRELAKQADENAFIQKINEQLQDGKPVNSRMLSGLPTVIYASRTHSQLSQAMKEMKKTAYSYMKAIILGSRDQMCIHPQLEREENSHKIMMCRLMVQTRSCKFYNKVDRYKVSPQVSNCNIMDIEDIVNMGKACGFCPYFMSKELKEQADIIFMPYNYLLDPFIRKSLGIELANTIVLLDEAHNVERMCEESASIQIKSSDMALAIDEVTNVMKMLSEDSTIQFDDSPKDFGPEDLCNLKELLMSLEQEIDKIDLRGNSNGLTYDGTYIFDLFGKVGIGLENYLVKIRLIDSIVQFLATVNEGPFARKGNNLQAFSDNLGIVFSEYSSDFMEKVKKCYKVHIQEEEVKQRKKLESFLNKTMISKVGGKIINYWCFSPGFGMNLLMKKGLRSLILTSGTLAPLKPLISELEIHVGVRLENPHIIGNDQILVKIVSAGPDSEPLNSNYQNRDNPRYMRSLGMSILNIVRMVPDGMLIFFPSYPIMLKCQQTWQDSGVWGNICNIKPIYVEPRDKISFNTAMVDYYSKIKDPNCKGAIFMGVCRGKVSEGLDFVDANGRTVIITGLPFPPLKDPKIVLKRDYLDRCHAQNKEFLKGQEWYSLEACRAVNQAIGRIIRHKDDYGAILLLDSRFNGPSIKNQMSLWVRSHIQVSKSFGELLRDLRSFFKAAGSKYSGQLAPLPLEYKWNPNADASSSSENLADRGEVVIHKRNQKESDSKPAKKVKLSVVPNPTNSSVQDSESSAKDYIIMTKFRLGSSFETFSKALQDYKTFQNLNVLILTLEDIFKDKRHLRYLIPGLETYIRSEHKLEFSKYCLNNGLLD